MATLLSELGGHNANIQGVSSLDTRAKTMAGPDYTQHYMPTRPDTDPLEAFREPDRPQRIAIEERPKVLCW